MVSVGEGFVQDGEGERGRDEGGGVLVGRTKKTKLLNPFWSRSFPGLFGSTDYRIVQNYFKSLFLPLPVLI